MTPTASGPPSAAELYAAIRADPDDLDLRHQYASAVADHDFEHADVIRLQIMKERLSRQGRRLPPDLSRHERRLAGATGPRIAGEVSPLVAGWQLRRGFPEVVEMTAESFLSTGAEVYRRAPVRHLLLNDVVGHLDTLVESPLLRRLSSLDLTGNPIGDDGVERLVRSPHLGGLRFLSLCATETGERGAEALAAAETLPNLQYLDFIANAVKLTPQPGSRDHRSGELLTIAYPAYGRQLVEQYGPRPWLTYTSPNPKVELFRAPDYGDV